VDKKYFKNINIRILKKCLIVIIKMLIDLCKLYKSKSKKSKKYEKYIPKLMVHNK
jgi:hypothetical protein